MVCRIVRSESEYQSNPSKRLETTTNRSSGDTEDRPLLECLACHIGRSMELTYSMYVERSSTSPPWIWYPSSYESSGLSRRPTTEQNLSYMIPCSRYETNSESSSCIKCKERAEGADSFSLRLSNEGGSGRTLMFLHTAKRLPWLEYETVWDHTHISLSGLSLLLSHRDRLRL